MTHTDWELQRERLSAYLDSELSSTERADIDAHLLGCEECQRELDALRQIRGVLRALPALELPRAFTLPEAPVVAAPRRRGAARWSRPAQALGGMAAAVGLGLLVASALPHPGALYSTSAASHPDTTFGGGSSASSAMPGTAAGAHATLPSTTVPSATATVPGATDTASGAAEHTPAYRPLTTPDAQPFPMLPVTGGTLLVGGAAAFTLGSLARRRGRDHGLPED